MRNAQTRADHKKIPKGEICCQINLKNEICNAVKPVPTQQNRIFSIVLVMEHCAKLNKTVNLNDKTVGLLEKCGKWSIIGQLISRFFFYAAHKFSD